MVLNRLCTSIENRLEPLELTDVADPRPGENEVLVKVSACGVCHTELDEIEGRTPPPRLPVIPGHQVVGEVVARGHGVTEVRIGARIGVAWIYDACGQCEFCRMGQENLCPFFKGTGRDANGGYAEYMTVPVKFVHPIPEAFSDLEAAPLLCAGAIGWRSIKLTGLKNGQRLGLTGFGASAHLVLKLVRHKYPDCSVFVFARNLREREFAMELGAVWAGATEDRTPEPLHSIIDTTPAWNPVLHALNNLEPGGRLVINAIRKEERDKNCLMELNYPEHLWLEKEIKSVANVTRSDVREFLHLAAEIPIRPHIAQYSLKEANVALLELKTKRVQGAKVLKISE